MNNTNSTTDLPEPSHCGKIGKSSRWLYFRAQDRGYFEFDTVGSSVPTILAVYNFTNYTALSTNLLACTTNSAPGILENVARCEVVPGAYYTVVVDGNNGAVGIIKLNWRIGMPSPPQGQLQFSAAAYTISETGGMATMAVRRAGGSLGTVAVNYATSGGTATAEVDYTNLFGTLMFGPGVASQFFTVPIVDDSISEGNETIPLILSNPMGGAILGGLTNAVLTILDNELPPETIKPTVAIINAPASNARLTNGMVTIQGKARDNAGLARVEVQLGSGLFQPAIGTSNWSAQIQLTPGTNVVRVRSIDLSDNISLTNKRTLIYVVTAPLSLQTNGNGKITGATNGQRLEIGRGYMLTAMPSPNFLFSNWTGTVTANTAKLAFLMQSNFVARANFVTNPFIATKGSYNGLFYEDDEVRHQRSGFFMATITDRGTFTGSLLSNGKRYALSGQFDLDGKATKTVPRPGTNALTVELQLKLASGTDKIAGTITDGSWVAELMADRAVFHARTNAATNYVGKYTLIILGSTNGMTSPEGDGFATVTVDGGGNVTFSGRLAEGTPVTQRAPLSKSGQWPLYVSLYSGKGSILSWVTFATQPTNELSGPLSWTKPPLTKYYPTGFANETELVGAIYNAPVGTTNRAIQITNGVVGFSGGNLSIVFTNQVRVGANNKVTNDSPNKLVLTLVTSSGLFNGTVTRPGTNKVITFKGALLQTRRRGLGYFLGTNQSGRVFFGPNPP